MSSSKRTDKSKKVLGKLDTNLKGRPCAACGRQHASLVCSRCHGPSYCDRSCQKRDWKHGKHKDQCGSVANRSVDVDSLQIHPSESNCTAENSCWICLEGCADDELLHGCVCADSGFVHLSCIVEYARSKNEPKRRLYSHCPTCMQHFHGKLRLGLSRALWEDDKDHQDPDYRIGAHVSLAQTLSSYGNNLQEAIQMMRASHADCIALYGDHKQARNIGAMLSMLLLQGRPSPDSELFAEAERLLRVTTSQLDSDNHDKRLAQQALADVLIRKGEPEEALALLQPCHEQSVTTFGAADNVSMWLGQTTAAVLCMLQRQKEGLKLFKETLAHQRRTFGKDDSRTLHTVRLLNAATRGQRDDDAQKEFCDFLIAHGDVPDDSARKLKIGLENDVSEEDLASARRWFLTAMKIHDPDAIGTGALCLLYETPDGHKHFEDLLRLHVVRYGANHRDTIKIGSGYAELLAIVGRKHLHHSDVIWPPTPLTPYCPVQQFARSMLLWARMCNPLGELLGCGLDADYLAELAANYDSLPSETLHAISCYLDSTQMLCTALLQRFELKYKQYRVADLLLKVVNTAKPLLASQRNALGPAHPDALQTLGMLKEGTMNLEHPSVKSAICSNAQVYNHMSAMEISIDDVYLCNCTFGGVQVPLSLMQEPTFFGIATALQQEELRVLTELHGPDHDEVLGSATSLGSVLANAGRYHEAAAIWGDTLKRQCQLSGHNSQSATLTKQHLEQLKVQIEMMETVTNESVEDGFVSSCPDGGSGVWRIPVLPDDQEPSMELAEDPGGVQFIVAQKSGMKAGTEISVSLSSYEKYGARIEGTVCSKGRVKFDLSRSRPPNLSSIEGINLKSAQTYQAQLTTTVRAWNKQHPEKQLASGVDVGLPAESGPFCLPNGMRQGFKGGARNMGESAYVHPVRDACPGEVPARVKEVWVIAVVPLMRATLRMHLENRAFTVDHGLVGLEKLDLPAGLMCIFSCPLGMKEGDTCSVTVEDWLELRDQLEGAVYPCEDGLVQMHFELQTDQGWNPEMGLHGATIEATRFYRFYQGM